MVRKLAEIRKAGRGTFFCAEEDERRQMDACPLQAINRPAARCGNAKIKSPDRGNDARLLSSFLGRLDRHFG
ncbi:MAG: hypothetical protein ACRECV_11995 [Xanthobacteraceae bacterium]